MKKPICCCVLLAFLVGCTPRYILKGTYQETPYTIPLAKTSNDLWLEIIEFLAQEKISPKFIKKKKHLIVTDTTMFRDKYTVENNLGRLEDSTKYVVLPVVKNSNYLKNAYAYWTIKIQTRHQKTAIVLELSKVTANYSTDDGPQKLIGNKVSTGVFEKKMQDFLQSKGLLQ
jgi:hypothetical protein